jgi:hypothetical protein
MMEARRKYNIAVRELRSEKQRQRIRRIRENLERYKNEQPVIDLERQLAGKLVDTKVMGALEHKGFMPPQHLMMIDAILTMQGATIEAELQRRINAINAMTAFCSVEEGRPMPRPVQSCRRPVPDNNELGPPAKQQRHVLEDNTEIALRQAKETVQVTSQDQRPTICFLCLGNSNLPLKDRIGKHATRNTRFTYQAFSTETCHDVNPPWPARGFECNVFGMEIACTES